MEVILLSNYVEYNANNRGNRTTDCVNRAISLAFDIDYNEVHNMLLKQKKEQRSASYKYSSVYSKVIKALGGGSFTKANIDEDTGKLISMTLKDFIDTRIPEGTFLVTTGGSKQHSDHIVCVIDGTIYDSWDSSSQWVFGFYEVEGAQHNFTDLSGDMQGLADIGYDLIGQLAAKYISKYNIEGQLKTYHSINDYSIKYFCDLDGDDIPAFKEATFTIVAVFTPTMDADTAKKKLEETIKVRMYDRFYAINKILSGKREGNDLFAQSGWTEKDKKRMHMTGVEARWFRTLPGWFQPFVTYLNIQDPGQYYDSYELWALPLKGDPRYPEQVELHGYNAADIKDEINRYKNNFERVDYDYSYEEEY